MQNIDQRGKIQTSAVNQPPATRPIPVASAALPTGSAAAVWTAPSDSLCMLSGLVLSNGNALAANITLHIGADATGEPALNLASVAGNEFADLSGVFMVPAGQSLWALSSVADVKVAGWATAYL